LKAASNNRIREQNSVRNHGILLEIGAVLAAPANTLKDLQWLHHRPHVPCVPSFLFVW
jgi:hypothetical protein